MSKKKIQNLHKVHVMSDLFAQVFYQTNRKFKVTGSDILFLTWFSSTGNQTTDEFLVTRR